MKLKFTQDAKDKYNGAKYEKGKTYDFEDARAKEVLAAKVDGKPVAIEVKAKAKKPEAKKADK